nr:hypothetical protein SYMBAF_10080 [Serratia symbiotica]
MIISQCLGGLSITFWIKALYVVPLATPQLKHWQTGAIDHLDKVKQAQTRPLACWHFLR